MKNYLDLAQKILDKGTLKTEARENIPNTLSLFGEQLRFDLSEGFPLMTTKRLSFKNIVVELLWFLRGDTNIKYLVDNGCNIWNEDAYNYYKKKHKEIESSEITILNYDEFLSRLGTSSTTIPNYIFGDCGKQYGWLWRNWAGERKVTASDPIWMNSFYYDHYQIDQIKDLIEGLKSNPMSRRHILTAWNPATLNDMALNACHSFVQFNCRPTHNKAGLHPSHAEILNEPDYYLDCQMYQRSADYFLGVPYNIASYSLLTHIMAKICNMVPGEFIHTFGDVHIYKNHVDQMREQISRESKELPSLKLPNFDVGYNDYETAIFSMMGIEDFELENYDPLPSIKGKLSTGLK